MNVTVAGSEVASLRSTDEVTVTVNEYGSAPIGAKFAGTDKIGELVSSVPKFGQSNAATTRKHTA